METELQKVEIALRQILRENTNWLSNSVIAEIKRLLKTRTFDENSLPIEPPRLSKAKTYLEYLKSDTWKATKEIYYSKTGRFCKYCKSTKNLEVHHKIYRGWGNEQIFIDLVSLCRDCHKKAHSNKISLKHVRRIAHAENVTWKDFNVKAKKLLDSPYVELDRKENSFLNSLKIAVRISDAQERWLNRLWAKHREKIK